jgi:hypothetical protein
VSGGTEEGDLRARIGEYLDLCLGKPTFFARCPDELEAIVVTTLDLVDGRSRHVRDAWARLAAPHFKDGCLVADCNRIGFARTVELLRELRRTLAGEEQGS